MKRNYFYITGPALLFVVFFSSFLTHRLEEKVRIVEVGVPAEDCGLSLKNIQTKSFPISTGEKQLITLSTENFGNNDKCWINLEILAAEKLEATETGVIYIFNLSESKVREIKDKYDDFGEYGENLVATYLKVPGSPGKLVKYPNTNQ